MTTEALPVAQLAARSREVHFGRTVATAFAWIFVAIGWIFGGIWNGLAFAAISARYGYWRGRGLTETQIIAKLAVAEPAPAEAQNRP